MKTYKLFLDDVRRPIQCAQYMNQPQIYYDVDWVVATDCTEFKKVIKERFEYGEFPAIISFDHDLAPEHYSASDFKHMVSRHSKIPESSCSLTGMDAARWIVDFCMDNNLKLPAFRVHSMNPAGRENIESFLTQFARAQN